MKKTIRIFEILCCFVYFVSYITRINFGAVIAEIAAAEGYKNSALSLVISAGFISYGIGQIISGAMGDKISAKKMIFIGFLITSACNLFVPLCTGISIMAVLWLINGFAQSMMWPPLLKLITEYSDGKNFSRICANVSAGGSAGTIFVYLTAPIFIRFGEWKSVFYFSGAAGIFIAIIWMLVIDKIISHLEPITAVKTKKNNPLKIREFFVKYGIGTICAAIVCQGFLRDGITTWLPSCISEVFNIEAMYSILISAAMPVFSIIGIKMTATVHQRWIKDEVRLSGYLFLTVSILLVIWGAIYSKTPVLSVILSSLICGLTHGINFLLICVVPKRFAGGGHVSLISGILNFCTYIGSAASSYAMAGISECFSWQISIFCWGVTALIGFLLCVKFLRQSGVIIKK